MEVKIKLLDGTDVTYAIPDEGKGTPNCQGICVILTPDDKKNIEAMPAESRKYLLFDNEKMTEDEARTFIGSAGFTELV